MISRTQAFIAKTKSITSRIINERKKLGEPIATERNARQGTLDVKIHGTIEILT
jgi:hypothetical protein